MLKLSFHQKKLPANRLVIKSKEVGFTRKFRIFFFVFSFLIIFPVGSSFFVRMKLEHLLKAEVKGNFVPVPGVPTFYFKNADFEWEHKVKFVSGDLKVEYDLFSLLRRSLRIKISGKYLQIKLLGDWAAMEGVQDATLDSLYADLEFDQHGIRELNQVEAKSPKFQFHVKKSENNKARTSFSLGAQK